MIIVVRVFVEKQLSEPKLQKKLHLTICCHASSNNFPEELCNLRMADG